MDDDFASVARYGDYSEEAIGVRIAAVRLVAGLSQAAFGKSIGTTGAVVGNWERGQHSPRHSMLANMCDLYDVTADFVLRGHVGRFPVEARDAYVTALREADLSRKANDAAKDARDRLRALHQSD